MSALPKNTPKKAFTSKFLSRSGAYASGAPAIMNSREHRENVRIIPACVTDLPGRGTASTTRQFSSSDNGLPNTHRAGWFRSARNAELPPVDSDLATITRTAWAWHEKAHPLKTGEPVRD
jgi:hypothetical protein